MRTPEARKRACALVAVALALLCAGCGFELAGSGPTVNRVESVYVDTPEPHSEFATTLRDALKINGIRLAERPDEARVVLHVLEDLTGQRILSVSAQNVPREFEVFYTVRFSLETGADATPEPQVVVASRNYSYDVTEVLGKSAEEQALRRTLAADLSRRVLRRLETAAAGSVVLPGPAPSGS